MNYTDEIRTPYPENDYRYHLMHHGVKGQKWGVRNAQWYPISAWKNHIRLRSPKALVSKIKNDRVDKSFKKWKSESEKRDNAILLGKEANRAKIAYEKNKKNKDLKQAYTKANKKYKKALSKNTTYRKGVVRQEVGSDASRKYLSEAKKLEKKLKKDPANKDLRKQYNYYSDRHDVERASARRAVAVSSKRSRRKAAVKRAINISVKTAASAIVINEIAKRAGVDSNVLNPNTYAKALKNVRDITGYMYF